MAYGVLHFLDADHFEQESVGFSWIPRASLCPVPGIAASSTRIARHVVRCGHWSMLFPESRLVAASDYIVYLHRRSCLVPRSGLGFKSWRVAAVLSHTELPSHGHWPSRLLMLGYQQHAVDEWLRSASALAIFGNGLGVQTPGSISLIAWCGHQHENAREIRKILLEALRRSLAAAQLSAESEKRSIIVLNTSQDSGGQGPCFYNRFQAPSLVHVLRGSILCVAFCLAGGSGTLGQTCL